jgi:hypothetical protein
MKAMKNLKILLMSALLMILLGGCAMLNPKPVPLPPGTLDAAAVEALFSGKSVESVIDKSGRVSLTYYNPNGELRQLQKGEKRSGTWNVRSDGRICLQFEGQDRQCRIIVLDGETYRKFIVKRDGNHEQILTYRLFRAGNLVDK